jgi:hypothetical protein
MLADRLSHRSRPGLIAFVHTEVDERLKGRGLGDRLILFGLKLWDRRCRSDHDAPEPDHLHLCLGGADGDLGGLAAQRSA